MLPRRRCFGTMPKRGSHLIFFGFALFSSIDTMFRIVLIFIILLYILCSSNVNYDILKLK